ncbi:hypothetical protein C805_02202 [Eubacterium sp. 14-2]|uniref:hypothetical protein n=1 Tax=Eubacterium sp. 14-2 TaxID=1235790 RepID=UPI0003412010|nr:hypothetical protein [Eubacterium sp. 14-2]EOT23991.1 hypothetical protein C805_02202 [Eubacterium sp. 14-2]
MIYHMTRMLDSMENAMKLQMQAKAEQRAEKAKQEEEAFREKLMRSASCKMELDASASTVKGMEDAVRRDQLAIMIMAGL